MTIIRFRFGRLLAVAALLMAGLGLGGCGAALFGAGATLGIASQQEKGIGGTISDTAIRAEINQLWFHHDVELFQRVRLSVQEGRVLLTGSVPDPDTRVDAVRLAWQADGVREVINEIAVEDTGGIGDWARDRWISTQLRSRLLFDPEIASFNYSIDTVNGVVYLMGVAQSRTELDRVTGHARNLAHVRQVVSYVRIKGPEGQRV
jgi:osmotically-inducible protein OsmY